MAQWLAVGLSACCSEAGPSLLLVRGQRKWLHHIYTTAGFVLTVASTDVTGQMQDRAAGTCAGQIHPAFKLADSADSINSVEHTNDSCSPAKEFSDTVAPCEVLCPASASQPVGKRLVKLHKQSACSHLALLRGFRCIFSKPVAHS